MLLSPKLGYDPGWLGQPKSSPTSGAPQYAFPSPLQSHIGGGGASYSYPGAVNDPTLAPGTGYGGGNYFGGPATGGGLPPGAITPPIQFAGGGIPNWMASQGWTVARGPNGFYWAPPSSKKAVPQYNFY